jgi:adenine-specific DNA-methyltransferase
MAKRKTKKVKQIETLTHDEATRKNIPTAELQSTAERIEEPAPTQPVSYERAHPLAEGEKHPRDEDLDPQIIWKGATIRLSAEQLQELNETGKIDIGEAQLTWRGKDTQDWSDLVVQAPPLYIQEKIHPKAIIENLKRESERRAKEQTDAPDLFDNFDGIDPKAKTEFYQHDQNWQNRMILGDSLQVMASLAEREGLRGKVQCIYFDPPYGIKFNSNWQVSTRSRDVKDGKQDSISREPEQVKAFRDTWNDGIHSYLTYLRDRMIVMRDLLAETGSVFVQIGDENVHRVRTIMDEVFGPDNFCSQITVAKTTGAGSPAIGTNVIAAINDHILWYAKNASMVKYRQIYRMREFGQEGSTQYTNICSPDAGATRSMTSEERADITKIPDGWTIFAHDNFTSQSGADSTRQPVSYLGNTYRPGSGGWKTNEQGASRLSKAYRLLGIGKTLRYKRKFDDFRAIPINNLWDEFRTSGFADSKVYVVQTNPGIVQRCILMTTDPGDLVFDPTCGSGTTAYAAEQWGRRWITADTSRVSLALARSRLMGARYPYYLLSDSRDGRDKEEKISGKAQSSSPIRNDIRQGFVFERAPHITLKSIANNAVIDEIWEEFQERLRPLQEVLNNTLNTTWQEWEIPPGVEDDWPGDAVKVHEEWWKLRIERQEAIDRSIAQKAAVEFLYDRPYEDNSKVRVAGPFTVESLSPHRVISTDDRERMEEIDDAQGEPLEGGDQLNDFTTAILENLYSAGVHQAKKEDRIKFNSLDAYTGRGYISAIGTFTEGGTEKRAGVFVGPEFGTVTRADLVAAAREANDERLDALIACGFNFDAHTTELSQLGPLPILKAKMNQDLHMSDELKNTGKGNLFTIIGEPDIEWDFDDEGNIVVKVLGLDVFDLKTSEVRSSEKDDIAAWFIDTDYDEESFFVRHAYFLGANDPYKALKTTLKTEIDKEAWESLYQDVSRPFIKPSTGRFAVKVINHFGDEVMKVFTV